MLGGVPARQCGALYPILDVPGSDASRYTPCVSLLTDLTAFTREHERRGELGSGVEQEVVWMTCPCGPAIVRPIDD
jgi:hypothetical protein